MTTYDYYLSALHHNAQLRAKRAGRAFCYIDPMAAIKQVSCETGRAR